jgi:hypothetical protein
MRARVFDLVLRTTDSYLREINIPNRPYREFEGHFVSGFYDDFSNLEWSAAIQSRHPKVERKLQLGLSMFCFCFYHFDHIQRFLYTNGLTLSWTNGQNEKSRMKYPPLVHR